MRSLEKIPKFLVLPTILEVWMWELDYREVSAKELMLLNCGVGEDSESPLDCKEIQPVHPKGNQSWILTGRTDTGSEAPRLWPPDVKNWLTGKDTDAGKDWRREEKGTREDETVGWHDQLNGHEFEQAQGSQACCSQWGCRVWHDWEPELNW